MKTGKKRGRSGERKRKSRSGEDFLVVKHYLLPEFGFLMVLYCSELAVSLSGQEHWLLFQRT